MEQRRCLGCMDLYDPEYGVCPHCGYVEGTPADEAVHMAPGTVLEGRYVMGKVLGYGGFGATYIAWDPVLEQKVAIKEYLPSEFSTRMPGIATVTVFGGDRSEQFREGMEKFVEEAKRLSKFQNEPGIVKIFDSFQANGTAYIIMEYLDGETLTSYLDREGTVSEEKVMEMLLPIMQSLQVVHNEGLLHRDIAPDNIFITKEGNVKLIDFGASRYATTSHSRSLTVIIKPGYSPEEQYRSHGDQGPHTDVYALAAVMYKMLTGMTPPDALERRAMIETKKKELLPDVHKKAKYVSPGMENAILNAMNIQIEDRTADIPAFLAELQADKPVKRRYGKIKKIDIYAWPLWLKIVIPAVLVASLVTGILLATGVIDFPSLFSGKVVVPEGMTTVPNVEGMTTDTAMQTLQDAGLTPVPKGNVESSYVDSGLILLQTPSSGSFAQMGTEIMLTVSSGSEVKGPVNGIATVPYVVWNTQADAEAKLQKAGLKGIINTVHDESVAEGMVVSQSVESMQQVAVNTEIMITISLGPNIEYRELSDGTLEVVAYHGEAEKLIIPSTYEGKLITSIGYNSFCKSQGVNAPYNRRGLTNSVTIPDSVINIGAVAFWACDGLTEVVIGNSVTTIGESAFSSCSNLETINIPDSVIEIKAEAFIGCTSLKTVYFQSDAQKEKYGYLFPSSELIVQESVSA